MRDLVAAHATTVSLYVPRVWLSGEKAPSLEVTIFIRTSGSRGARWGVGGTGGTWWVPGGEDQVGSGGQPEWDEVGRSGLQVGCN